MIIVLGNCLFANYLVDLDQITIEFYHENKEFLCAHFGTSHKPTKKNELLYLTPQAATLVGQF